MGSVMLAVTGGEALFADMGHFGKKPIRIGWFSAVYPALIMSYLGQGAYLISGAEILNENIFFSMVPRVALIPVVALATYGNSKPGLNIGGFQSCISGCCIRLDATTKYYPHSQRSRGPNLCSGNKLGFVFRMCSFSAQLPIKHEPGSRIWFSRFHRYVND